MTERTRKCGKCGGKGKIAAYNHIANGKCSACCGSGVMVYKPSKKQETMAEYLARQNAMIAETWGK